MIGRLASSFFNAIPKQLGLFPNAVPSLSNQLVNGGCNVISVRTKMRNYWPRPNEVRRIKKCGWVKRMSTLSGRKIIMRRILKGCHVLSH